MNPILFDTHIVVDWSARSKPAPRSQTKDAIWWAVAQIDGHNVTVAQPEYAQTRDDARRRLSRLITEKIEADRRVLVGFDFPFGYPGGVAERLTGQASALALWGWLAKRIEDNPDNSNNRYEVASKINEAYSGHGPCWGRPSGWDFPLIPIRASVRAVRSQHPPERRIAEHHAKGSKTVWQSAYAGSVGSQVLLGLPHVMRLAEDPPIRESTAVWPLQTGLRKPTSQVVLAEVYPSLLRDEIGMRKRENEILDRAQVRVNAEAFARLDATGGLAPLFSGAPNLDQAERQLIETEEAWILGLGHEQALKRALPPLRRSH